VLSFEAIVAAAAGLAAVVAVPVGLLCVRYVKIYFGMLTLAFGMLFYSFLYKFYALTGGDEGLRVLRPLLLGRPFAELDKVGFLTGPFYYYALALLALATLAMRRIVRSPFGLSLRAIRENADKAAFVGVSVRRYRFYAFVIAADHALNLVDASTNQVYQSLPVALGHNLAANQAALADQGRIVIIGVGAGAKAELDMYSVMQKRASITGSTLRYRPLEEKALVTRRAEAHVVPLLESGTVRVLVDETFPLEEAAAAYERFEAGGKFGKIVLVTS